MAETTEPDVDMNRWLRGGPAVVAAADDDHQDDDGAAGDDDEGSNPAGSADGGARGTGAATGPTMNAWLRGEHSNFDHVEDAGAGFLGRIPSDRQN